MSADEDIAPELLKALALGCCFVLVVSAGLGAIGVLIYRAITKHG